MLSERTCFSQHEAILPAELEQIMRLRYTSRWPEARAVPISDTTGLSTAIGQETCKIRAEASKAFILQVPVGRERGFPLLGELSGHQYRIVPIACTLI